MERHYLRVAGDRRLAVDIGGESSNPALLLLHGFPSSAQTFRRLTPLLAERAFIIAPDLPGYGESDSLASMTFAAMGDAVLEALDHFSIGRRYIYLHDYGAPVGFHVALHAPEQVAGLIVQNANAHDSGFGPQWADTQAYWANPTPENEAAATAHLTRDGIRGQYIAGIPGEIASTIDPAVWEADWRAMNSPGRLAAQRALVADYGRYASRFAKLQAYLRNHQPSALMLWGRHDAFFALAETVSWMEDLPRMDAHVLDAGHFLLETRWQDAARLIGDFLGRHTEAA